LNGRDPAAARDQADVRLGAKTVYFMNTDSIKIKEHNALLETGEDISVKVLSQKDFEARKGFHFLRNVIFEGVKIV
jgi:hypothetical protein